MTRAQQAETEDYSDIFLTPEETERALNHFKMLKKRDMDQWQLAENRRAEIRRTQQAWTYDQLKADVLQRADQLPFKFFIDKDNELAFHQLCLFFSDDKRFEDYHYVSKNDEKINFSLDKGILLTSNTKGTGKSILMQLFSRNKRRPFICLPTMNISNEFVKNGPPVVDYYSTYLHVRESKSLFFFTDLGICYEDLGSENDKNSYGNKSNVMYEIIFNLYEKFRNLKDWSAFQVTSNYNGNEFENRYDERIRSRMREMFNFIELPGKDRRK